MPASMFRATPEGAARIDEAIPVRGDRTRNYTGVGSRETPENVKSEEIQLAYALAAAGWTLRSGAAEGSDAAFERGADAWLSQFGSQFAPGNESWKTILHKQIFLPWKNFSGHTSPLHSPPDEAYSIAASIHPAWRRLSPGARSLHARNIQQVLGEKLDSPSSFVLCWTPEGKAEGGTRTAIILAQRHGIPVYNLGFNGSNAVRPRVRNGQLEIWQNSSASWIIAPMRKEAT